MFNKLIDVLDTIQWKVRYSISEFMWAIRYRTFDKYNIIKIHSLKPGYYESDTRLVHGMFDLLVDFVEVEKAHMERVFGEKKTLKEKLAFRLLPSCLSPRSRELGMKYIDWEISLKDQSVEFPEAAGAYASQSEAAQAIKDIYTWWKDIRPLRKDPMDESGFSAFCDSNRGRIFKFRKLDNSDCSEMYDELTPEEKEEEHKLLMLSIEIEERQHKEDEDMLIKLIKVRRALWT